MITGLPKVKKERYIKYIRTLVVLIPNFLPHHSHTPKALCSNQLTIFLITIKYSNFFQHRETERMLDYLIFKHRSKREKEVTAFLKNSFHKNASMHSKFPHSVLKITWISKYQFLCHILSIVFLCNNYHIN